MNEFKAYKSFWLSVFLIVIGCGLLIAGMIITPTGEIHNSVLIAFGEILTFVGALLGIDTKWRHKNKEP